MNRNEFRDFDEEETPWLVRVLVLALPWSFVVAGPFLIYKFGNFIYADDFFWQSENRIYVMVALIFLYAISVFLLLFKVPDLIDKKKSESKHTFEEIEGSEYEDESEYFDDGEEFEDSEFSEDSEEFDDSDLYEAGPSPTRMKKYMDEIVERERKSLD